MKLWKKIMSMLVCAGMLTTMMSGALAVQLTQKQLLDVSEAEITCALNDCIQNDERVQITPLTPEQFAEKYREITGRDAIVPYGGNRQSLITYTDENVAGSGYAVEVGCLVEVACGQSCTFVEIVPNTAYSKATESGNYTWNESIAYAQLLGSSPNKYVELRARGVIEVAVNKSNSQGGTMGVGLQLVNLGYTYSNTVGSTEYFRKTAEISHRVYN